MPCSDHRPLLEAIAGLALVAGLALACASAEPVFRLDATEADSSAVWVQGRQIVTRTAGHLRVHLAYDRTTQAGHVFHLGVENLSDTTYVVDPARVYAALRSVLPPSERSDLESPIVRDTLAARDPEARLLALDQKRSQEVADAMNDRLLEGLVLALDAADDVTNAATGGRTPDEQAVDAAEDAERAVRNAEDRARDRRRIRGLEASRRYWSDAVLRKTTLVPGTYVAGWVYVPVKERARFVAVHVPVGPHTVRVPYQQLRFEP
jgi:hypothetical protein